MGGRWVGGEGGMGCEGEVVVVVASGFEVAEAAGDGAPAAEETLK